MFWCATSTNEPEGWVEDEVKAEYKRVCSMLNLNLNLLQMLRPYVPQSGTLNANAIPGRLGMETGGFSGIMPRIRSRGWNFPTVLCDFRL